MPVQVRKIKNLPNAVSIASTDVFAVDTNPAGATVTRKATVNVVADAVAETSELEDRYVRLDLSDRGANEIPTWNSSTSSWDSLPYPSPTATITVLGVLADPTDLPVSGSPGDAYVIGVDLWVWDAVTSAWVNAGSFTGFASVTTAQRDALTPVPGQTVYNVDVGRLQYWDGSVWFDVGQTFFLAVTTTQRNALTPFTGLVVYNTTDSELQYYDGTSWISLVADQLANLLDVDVSGVNDTDLLTYDGTAGEWVPLTRVLGSLTDVNTSGASDGDALVFNSSTGTWVAGQFPPGADPIPLILALS